MAVSRKESMDYLSEGGLELGNSVVRGRDFVRFSGA